MDTPCESENIEALSQLERDDVIVERRRFMIFNFAQDCLPCRQVER